MIGVRCKDGIVFASENIVVSKLHEANATKHLFTVDQKIGVVSGERREDERDDKDRGEVDKREKMNAESRKKKVPKLRMLLQVGANRSGNRKSRRK